MKCLKTKHRVDVVGDLMRVTKRLINNTPGHRHNQRKNCKCYYCKEDTRRECPNLSKCVKEAQEVLDCLHPKFDPRNKPPMDNMSLTPQEKKKC